MRLVDCLRRLDSSAIYRDSAEEYITHRQLQRCVQDFRLPVAPASKKPVVAVAIPNGPLLAVAIIAISAYFVAAPVNPSVGHEQLQADILQSGASIVITTAEEYQRRNLGQQWTIDEGISVYLLDLDSHRRLTLANPSGVRVPGTSTTFNRPEDTCIQLFTSGTSGTKKLVPITTQAIVSGAHFVIESWGLSSSEVCLNMMPLHHVGGLVRNVFAPIFAGGSTICCSVFDPTQFWDLVEQDLPTWYYASPTMHSLILDEAKRRPEAVVRSRIRLICNAAGGLLPSLAAQLQDVFQCTILPSYGMTECMPISTPPLNYRLERSGTSGVAVGPEITILDGSERPVNPHVVGRINVRGMPLFSGYLKSDGSLDRSAFNEDGWFDTGDLGYLDEDGYLYVTGRSKEVINRGGELISPFEVEDNIVTAAQDPKSPTYGRVAQALAFSVPHNVLQEVVGIVLVTPPGKPRVDIRAIQQSLRSRLQQAKWPNLVVYMDDLPKRNNKIVRSKLSGRLSLPDLEDRVSFADLHWEAECPPPDTDLSQPIPSNRCAVDLEYLMRVVYRMIPGHFEALVQHSSIDGEPEVWLAPRGSGLVTPEQGQLTCVALKDDLTKILDNYLVPGRIRFFGQALSFKPDGSVDWDAFDSALRDTNDTTSSGVAGRVRELVAEVLSRTAGEIDIDTDFFSLGGDSIRAGRLLSMLRSEFKCRVPIELIFNNGSPRQIASYIEAQQEKKQQQASAEAGDAEKSGINDAKRCSSTNPFLMAFQLLPILLLYPMRRAVQWTVFLVALATAQTWPTNDTVVGRLFNITVATTIAKIICGLALPWVGIAAKWLIIGRYRPGLYPMWGAYHTRWWIVQKIVDISGIGFFNMTNFTRITYYRLMGAQIGRGVSMGGVRVGEWDLLEVGDGATLEGCICRPFAGEKNATMSLARISIGRNAVVCKSAIVAPGTTVPDDTCIGPNSSSWELGDADEAFRDLPSNKLPGAHWALTAFGTVPLYAISYALSLLPWWLGLIGLAWTQPAITESPVLSIVDWFASANRIGYHYLALVLRVTLSPFFTFAFVVLVRWVLNLVFGPLKPGPANARGQIDRWRMSLIKTLMPPSQLHLMTELMGQHYEGTSRAIRLLGGKVGKRVYWPGTGPAIGDYHLIDVRNDVVFGSRSQIVTSDGLSSEVVTINDKAMIADRVSLLPGVTIGESTVLGSGALTRRGKSYEDGTTWVGSRGGDAICLRAGAAKSSTATDSDAETRGLSTSSSPTTLKSAYASREEKNVHHVEKGIDTPRSASPNDSESENESETSSSPFGRAFYQGRAPYHVLGQFPIFLYSAFTTAFTAFYWNVAFIVSIQAVYLVGFHQFLGRSLWQDTWLMLGFVAASVSIVSTALVVLALAAMIVAKWAIIGRRTPGNYDWDRSSYCQRWQVFLNVEKLRRQCFRGHGILGMLTGTQWAVLYFRALGARIGRDCALFANGQPSLYFTEPDLLTLGDRVVVDDASLVGHINTRGKFDLNELHVGDGCVLRSGSRLLSGARMGKGSRLMEHTLVMAGDEVDEDMTLQGWPAEAFDGGKSR
ncbi:hypothetical protein F4778DRAFT_781700 [Xylariomycetidae sp. FL2044]|nr:hypothetical protein F4778DRAFT_781700 [Xylariomycetidae sp. FL2044]